jgi:hypothetical protein
MVKEDYLQQIRSQFNSRVDLTTKRKGLYQLVAPFYHEDGDMYDIYIEDSEQPGLVRVTDRGLTLMRLSYTFNIDTPNKERIYRQILTEHLVQDDNGELFTVVSINEIYPAILRFSRAITAITNMGLYRRDIVRNLFYDMFAEFVTADLSQFHPQPDFHPLLDREELEVDFMIPADNRPIYLFGAKDGAKARLITIACLEFIRTDIRFRSVVIHDNFESLSAKDRRIITNVVDKQFTDLEDFEKSGAEFLRREVA